MHKLSAVVITFNEENNLERCLVALKKVADEVIVLDSFSTDNTEEIAKKCGAKFYENKWEGINAQRNYSLGLCDNDFILSIDADEVLTNKMIEGLINLKNDGFKADGYIFNRLTNYCGKWIRHGGWYPDRKLRLFNKNKGSYQGKDPHDVIVMENNSHVIKTNLIIAHYAFNSLSDHSKRVEFFSEIGAKEAFEKGKKIYFIIHIILNPFYTFCKKYFLQLGFLDGFYGFVICINSAYANFLKYVKIWQAKHANNHFKN